MTPVIPLLLAAPGLPGETALVAACQSRGSALAIVRRCVDAVDLLGAGAGGSARIAVIGPSLPGLTGEVVARLMSAGLHVVGVVDEGDEDGERHLRRLLIDEVVSLRISPTGADAQTALRSLVEALRRQVGAGADGSAPGSAESMVPDRSAVEVPGRPGRLVAVWGPTGAPGRTSVAIALADEAARSGVPSLLVDADTYGGAMATLLGMWDEASGLALACRRAETGHLDIPALAECARQIGPDLRILSGVVHADRWPELRGSALRRLWEMCRMLPGLTVVDIGFCLESDEDGVLSRRHAAALTAMAAADLVVAVGSADPLGLGRLVAALPEAREAAGAAEIVVALTRVRSSALGRDPQRQAVEVLAELGDVHDRVVLIPDDRAGFEACAREGRTLAELAPGSAARAVMRDLAAQVIDRVGVQSPVRDRGVRARRMGRSGAGSSDAGSSGAGRGISGRFRRRVRIDERMATPRVSA